MIDIRVDFNSVDENGWVTSLVHRASSSNLEVGMKVNAYDSDGNSVEAVIRSLENGAVALEKFMDTWRDSADSSHRQGVMISETSTVISGLDFGLTRPGFDVSTSSEVQAS